MGAKTSKKTQTLILTTNTKKFVIGNFNLQEIDSYTVLFNNEEELLADILKHSSDHNPLQKFYNDLAKVAKEDKAYSFHLEYEQNGTQTHSILYSKHQDMEKVIDYAFTKFKYNKDFITKVVLNDYNKTIIKSKQNQELLDRVEKYLKKVTTHIGDPLIISGIEKLYNLAYRNKNNQPHYNAYRVGIINLSKLSGAEYSLKTIRESEGYDKFLTQPQTNGLVQQTETLSDSNFTTIINPVKQKIKRRNNNEWGDNTPFLT